MSLSAPRRPRRSAPFVLLPVGVLVLLSVAACRPAAPSVDRAAALRACLQAQPAEVGVSVLSDSGTVFACNDTVRLPLLSVFKFPLAMAVLDRMGRQGTGLDTVFLLTPDDLREHTYSPLRDRHPTRRAAVRMDSLLIYSVALSDNNACDVLLRYVGGPRAVERYVRRLGIRDFSLSATEADMHRDSRRVYDNAASAAAVSRLFRLLLRGEAPVGPYGPFLCRVLEQTSTGADKLRAGLPADVRLGHKTGSSDRRPDGVKVADNDAGYVVLPDGRRYYVTVLVAHSPATDAGNAALIAHVAREVHALLTTSPPASGAGR